MSSHVARVIEHHTILPALRCVIQIIVMVWPCDNGLHPSTKLLCIEHS